LVFVVLPKESTKAPKIMVMKGIEIPLPIAATVPIQGVSKGEKLVIWHCVSGFLFPFGPV